MAKNSSIQAITGIAGDLTFSKMNVWLWVKISPTEYEFQDYRSREQLARNLDLALASLLSSDERGLEFQLIVSSKPFESKEWIRSIHERAKTNNPNPELPYFLSDMHSWVENQNFREKVVFLGVNLGNRNEYGVTKTALALGPLNNMLNSLSGVKDEYMNDKELQFWNMRARPIRSGLASSSAKATEVYADELAYLIKRNFYPGMASPVSEELSLGNAETWGVGELASLFDAKVENNSRFLKITQMVDGREVVGYRATLCFSKFPETLYYPERDPWIHFASGFDFPIDFYSRFTLEPTRKVRKEVNRKLKEAQDQARNQTSAGGSISMQVQEQLNLGQELDFALSKGDNIPWVYGRHRIVVTASTEEELKERAKFIIDQYKGLDIQLVWPTGDQLNLLLENLPNDKVRLPAYYQRQELSIISAGVPAGAGNVGDAVIRTPDGRPMGWLGPYLGHTTGHVTEPVFMSVHSAIAKNNPPGLVITGSPGAGKSFTAFTLTYQMALSGIWTIYIDPKGDAIPMMNLPGMQHARLLDLKDGNDGILDPFSIVGSPAEQKELALETILLFMGGQSNLSPRQQVALNKTIQSVAAMNQPSLNKVVDTLMANDEPEVEALGQSLNFIRELPFARLCFSAQSQNSLRIDQGLTIITLLGLDLPNSLLDSREYTNSNRLAVSIMYLLTSFTRRLMMSMNKSHPKAIAIDEAWAVTSTPQGKKMVLEVARMGRSLNTGLVLVSQNAGDFLGEGVTNSVSTRLAFRSTNSDEIDNVLRFFDLEITDSNREVIRSLRNGECLIKDADQRIARVQVDNWNALMSDAFNTNPETRKNN